MFLLLLVQCDTSSTRADFRAVQLNEKYGTEIDGKSKSFLC